MEKPNLIKSIQIDDVVIVGKMTDNNFVVEFEVIDSDGGTLLKGSIKWDGCINWDTGDIMYHCCSEKDINNVSVYLQTARYLGKTLMPYTIY